MKAQSQHAALRKKAAKSKLSLNPVIAADLSNAVVRKKADLSDVVGEWTPDPKFDAIIASQRKIDHSKWK